MFISSIVLLQETKCKGIRINQMGLDDLRQKHFQKECINLIMMYTNFGGFQHDRASAHFAVDAR